MRGEAIRRGAPGEKPPGAGSAERRPSLTPKRTDETGQHIAYTVRSHSMYVAVGAG